LSASETVFILRRFSCVCQIIIAFYFILHFFFFFVKKVCQIFVVFVFAAGLQVVGHKSKMNLDGLNGLCGCAISKNSVNIQQSLRGTI